MIVERKAKLFLLGHMEDIIRYQYTFKPHENADYIFCGVPVLLFYFSTATKNTTYIFE